MTRPSRQEKIVIEIDKSEASEKLIKWAEKEGHEITQKESCVVIHLRK
jgi:TusA-related sulfurtransferase